MSFENFNELQYYSDKISDVNLNTLKNICHTLFEKTDKKPANKMLAGHINHEYVMPQNGYEIIFPIVSSIANSIVPKSNWNMDSLWINYQKKYEFNPLHNHSGVFSFVIWVQIPYNINDELNLDFVKKSNRPCASAFSLVYNNPIGMIEQKPFFLDKSDEGKLIMFPSQIHHMVYPFYTSDDYRISIAGNISPSRY